MCVYVHSHDDDNNNNETSWDVCVCKHMSKFTIAIINLETSSSDLKLSKFTLSHRRNRHLANEL